MKISKTTNNNISTIDYSIGEKKVSENSNDTFRSTLSRVHAENYEAKIASLLDQIEAQAKKFSKKIDIRELKLYRKLVSEFLDEAINNSHKFSKENKLDRLGRHRVYAIIKRINEKMEDLTKEVLNDEKDNLKILQQLDDIRGLILDIST